MQPPDGGRKRPDWLPSRTALLVVAIAFAAGLLLFLALWLDQRSNNDFYKADGVPRSVEGQAFEPLPAPVPATDSSRVGEEGRDGQPFGQPPASSQPATPAPGAPPPLAPAAPPAGEVAPPSMAGTSQPRPVNAPSPQYPRAAQRRRQEGTVVLRVQVDAGGNPVDIEVVNRSGSRSLDRAAVDAVRRWHFAPATRNGQPVPGTIDVPIEFTLQR